MQKCAYIVAQRVVDIVESLGLLASAEEVVQQPQVGSAISQHEEHRRGQLRVRHLGRLDWLLGQQQLEHVQISVGDGLLEKLQMLTLSFDVQVICRHCPKEQRISYSPLCRRL